MNRYSLGPWFFIAGGVALVLFLAIPQSGTVTNTTPAKVSLDTTNFEAQLRDNNLPDFVETLNRQLNDGVDPAANVEASLRTILGPKGIPDVIRGRYYKLLGIPLPDDDEGNFFTTFADHLRQLKLMPPNVADVDHLEMAMTRPWSADEFPQLADWLAKNDTQLDAAVQATTLSQMYVPLVHPTNARGLALFGIPLPACQQHRDLAQALICRATLRARDNRLAEAWEDLMACHRLARHVSNGGLLTEAIVALSIESKTCEADRVVARSGKLTAELARSMEQDLRDLPAMPGLERHLNRGERLRFVDGVISLAKHGPSVLQQLSGDSDSAKQIPMFDQLLHSMIDWDEVLRIGNEYFDRIAAAASAPTPAERKEKAEAIERELQQLTIYATSNPFSVLSGNKQQRSKKLAVGLLRVCLPTVTACLRSRDAALTQMELTRLELMLIAYRAEHADYPRTLAALCPEYLDEIPLDPLTNSSFVYDVDGSTARLYSLGLNQRDDGGKTDRSSGRLDDIVVDLPQ